ncbi:MAG TPA: hypothetical protein VK094_00120 [Pseudogracilibacillus sp.]|nr:hypothetical protein [Pseudogracilibacillus sp.]
MAKQFEIYVTILIIIIAFFIIVGFAKEVESNDNRHIDTVNKSTK